MTGSGRGQEPGSPALPSAVGPVADALLGKAKRDAARARAEACAAADTLLTQTRAEAAQILTDARAAGRSEATASARVERIRARRKARAIVLAARREVYEELRRRVHRAVTSLWEEDPATVARLRRLARDRAGGDAQIVSAPGGGVIAVASGRRVDCSVSSLADRAVHLLGAEVERLWES